MTTQESTIESSTSENISEKKCRTCGATDRPFGKRHTSCNICLREYYKEYRRQHPSKPRIRPKKERHQPFVRSERTRLRIRTYTKKYSERYPEKTAAKNKLNWAIRTGLMVRPLLCSCCGQPSIRRDGTSNIHGHHYKGYDHPLDVIWLCAKCHSDEHRKHSAAAICGSQEKGL